MHDEGRLVLVSDARIDNRRELAAAFGIARPDAVGDREIILRAYERWGVRCAEHLIGDFAFAIWDRPAQAVFCARDPMGVRPFYYHLSDRIFAFASEIKALFAVPGIPRAVDDHAVARYIACLHDDREQTLYRGIVRLPAAHGMMVSRTRVERAEHWRADAAPAVRFASDDQYVDAFRETFSRSVAARLRSDTPVGATLSGGLDSSSLVCMARRLAPDVTLPTFSLIFPSLPAAELELIDERPFIDSVLRTPGLSPHFVRGDLVSPLGDRAEMLRCLDEPHIASNLYLHRALYGAARDSGVRVLLDGFDGDAAISHGFGRLNTLLAREDWPAFDAEARAFAGHRGKPAESVLPHFGLPSLQSHARRGRVRPWLRMARSLAGTFPVSRRELIVSHGVTPAINAARGRLRRGDADGASPASLLRPEFARAVARALHEVEDAAMSMATADERAMHLDTISQPLYQLTLEIADKAAHAFGIEPRYPFFDRRLIEFCVGLPDEQKFAQGWPRFLFRRAMQGILPPAIQWRATKGNLAPNFDRQLRATDRPAAERACRNPALARHVEPARIEATARRYFSGATWGDPDGMLLFRTTLLADWLSAAEGGDEPQSDTRGASPNGIATPLEAEPVACLPT